MKSILITGGTVFVSKYVAIYYVKKDYTVYVLNRNHKEQVEGVTLIEGDRNNLGTTLQGYHFDVVLDITAYNQKDIHSLLDAIDSFDEYIFISSSAVYPEYTTLPFKEDSILANNIYWKKYGTDKIEAEQALLNRVPDAYILRPPYLYGPMNNVYREAFIFDCAMQDRKFYLPKDGKIQLQFFYIEDLCKFIDSILHQNPNQHIFNVGNKETISIKDWVTLCYQTVGKKVEFININEPVEQRNYFSFYDYEYYLEVSAQNQLLPNTKSLQEGLMESYNWYISNQKEVSKKPYIAFIDNTWK